MVRSVTEVAVVGGGIAGVTAAAALAESGLSVTLLEQGRLAAAASGENTGTLLQQTEPEVAAMLRETVPVYRELAESPVDFGFTSYPELLLARDEQQLEIAACSGQFARDSIEPALEQIIDLPGPAPGKPGSDRVIDQSALVGSRT